MLSFVRCLIMPDLVRFVHILLPGTRTSLRYVTVLVIATRLSVTFVHRTQTIERFGNVYTPFSTIIIG